MTDQETYERGLDAPLPAGVSAQPAAAAEFVPARLGSRPVRERRVPFAWRQGLA